MYNYSLYYYHKNSCNCYNLIIIYSLKNDYSNWLIVIVIIFMIIIIVKKL